jgi:hypothetical protein
MKSDGQEFLAEFSGSAPNSFEGRFANISTRLDLGNALCGKELSLLYQAAFNATLCNIAFNGLGGCGGEIRPDRELNRTMLETRFMFSRDRFFGSAGWRALPKSRQESIERIFLTVFVTEENLAH